MDAVRSWKPRHGIVDGLIEVFRSGEGLVSEVMALQVAPEHLDIVQL